MYRIPAIQFTYELWRGYSLKEFGIAQRKVDIIDNKNKLRTIAIGYTEGYKLLVRPKIDYIAIMFFANEITFWTHITTEEFNICFPELQKYTKSIKK